MKHFTGESTVNLSKVDRERKLEDMLAEGASIDRHVQEAPAVTAVWVGVEEE